MNSKEIFSPASRTLRQIFGNTDSFYQVPDYQRPYRWQDDQVEQLWEDLYSSFQNWVAEKKDDDSYFLGSIILTKGDSDDHYDIVDGQQRLTTLTILFSVVRDLFPTLNTTTTNTIKNSIKNIIDGKQRLRFTTAIDKQNDFVHTIINGIQFPEKFTSSDKKKQPYINTAVVFREKLEEISAEEVETFINYIFDHVCLISITCHSPSFAIRLFQVLNARGLDLSPADLIKSHLMNKLPDDSQKEQFITSWRQIEGISNDVQEGMDELLNYYLYYLKAANPEKGLFEEMIALLKGKESNTVIFEIKKFCEAYKNLYNSQDKNIYALYYLRHELYWKSILTAAATLEFSDLNGLAKSLRNYYFLHWIAGYSSVKIKQPSFRIIQMVKEKKSLSEIKDHTSSLITPEVRDRFKKALIYDVYNTQWFKPMLLVLEYSQVEQPLSYLELDKNIHVEHVLPEKYRKHEYWKKLFTAEQADLHLNTLANLTLLSGKQNISASNNPFPEKITVYEGKGKDGLVPFRLSQWIRDRYNGGAKDWDAEALKKRFEWMIGNIAKEFEIELSGVTFESIGTASDETTGAGTAPTELEEDAVEPANFHAECMEYVSKKLNKKFERITASLYRTQGCTATCRVSKEHNRGGKGFWFAFKLDQKEILTENPENNVLVLGCGSPSLALVIPGKWFLQQLDSLNTTVRPNQMYWHIHLLDENSKIFLIHRGGNKIDVTNFLLN